MKTPILDFTEKLIFSLKTGQSLTKTLEDYKFNQPLFFTKYKILTQIPTKKLSPVSSITFELSLILRRGLKGLPILKSLEEYHAKLFQKLDFAIEEQTKKAPLKALLPLFFFQVPSLGLLFFYPLIREFMSKIL